MSQVGELGEVAKWPKAKKGIQFHAFVKGHLCANKDKEYFGALTLCQVLNL
jgi:hypothetical protein